MMQHAAENGIKAIELGMSHRFIYLPRLEFNKNFLAGKEEENVCELL